MGFYTPAPSYLLGDCVVGLISDLQHHCFVIRYLLVSVGQAMQTWERMLHMRLHDFIYVGKPWIWRAILVDNNNPNACGEAADGVDSRELLNHSVMSPGAPSISRTLSGQLNRTSKATAGLSWASGWHDTR